MTDRKKWQRPALGLGVLVLLVLLLVAFPSALQGRAAPDSEPPPAGSITGEVTNAAFCDYVTQIPKAECLALVDLHDATNGSVWGPIWGWLATYTPCSWNGVVCSGGHVIQLILWSHGLAGNIPSSLGNLSHLQELHLWSNQLTGSIPTSLGNLSSLQRLHLEQNNLTGSVPTSLGNLSNLQTLGLDHNSLSGALPQSLTNLTGLQYFHFNATLLCEPSDAAFQAWLASISSVYSTGVLCATPTATTAPFATLSGRVYEGTTGLEPPLSTPLNNVRVDLFCSNEDYPDMGAIIATTYTNAQGWYGLGVTVRNCKNYYIQETNLSGYTSDGATVHPGGGAVVKTADLIQYAAPLFGKTWTGNKFWDKSQTTKTPTPTGTASRTPTRTATRTSTRTPGPSSTPTRTPTLGPSPTPTHTSTSGPSPTSTKTATSGPSPTPTATFRPEANADLSISKTLDAALPVAPGTTITYTLMITNAGPSAAPNVVVSDTLPLFPDRAWCECTASRGYCDGGTGPVPPDGDPTHIWWRVGDMPFGVSESASVVCQVLPDACGSAVNLAEVTSDIPDPNPGNNQAEALVEIGPCEGADLEIVKISDLAGSVKPGGTILYTVLITNNGPSLVSTIVVSDVIPPGLTISWLYSACVVVPQGSATVVRCEYSGLPPNMWVHATLFRATVDEQTCGPIINTVTITSDTPDPDLSNNTAQLVTMVEPCPPANIRVVKTLIDPPGGVANVGDVVRFKIEVQNTGATSITGELQDNFLTAEFDFVSATPIQSSHCGNNTNRLLTWQHLTIPPGGTLTFEIRMRTKIPRVSAQNCAKLVYKVAGEGGDLGANWIHGPSSCASVQVQALDGRNFTVTKKFTLPTNHVAQLGDWLTFETTWLNTGTETATEVRLFDHTSPPSVGSNPLQGIWLLPFKTGDLANVTIGFKAMDIASPAVNFADWTATWPDGTKETQSASDYVYIVDGPVGKGLFVTKTLMDPLPTAAISDTVTFHIAITNATGGDLPALSLTDTFPAQCLSFTGASTPPDSVVPGTLTWNNIGPLPVGDTVGLDVFFHADAACPAALNCAAAQFLPPGGQTMYAAGCDVVPILGERPQIVVTKRRLGPSPVVVGDMVQWEIEIENVGTAPLPVVPLHDGYQVAYFDFDSAAPAPDNADLVNGRLDWSNLGSLPPGGKHTVIVRLIAKSPGVGATNCAETHYTVGSSNLVPSDCDTVDIRTEPPSIRVQKERVTDDPTKPVAAGDTATFKVTVINTSPVPLSNVEVQDLFPDGCLKFVSASGMATQQPAPGTLLWQIPSLAPSASESWNVVMKAVAPCIPVQNCVHASGFGPEGAYVEDNACAEMNIEPPEPGLSVKKRLAGPPQMPAVGSIFQFDIVVQNTGNSIMGTVLVHDWYDRDCMEFVGAVPDPDWENPATGEIHWDNVGPLGPGDAAVISVFMRGKGVCLPATWNCSRAWWEVNGQPQLDAMDCTDVPIGPPRHRIYLPVTMKE